MLQKVAQIYRFQMPKTFVLNFDECGDDQTTSRATGATSHFLFKILHNSSQ